MTERMVIFEYLPKTGGRKNQMIFHTMRQIWHEFVRKCVSIAVN